MLAVLLWVLDEADDVVAGVAVEELLLLSFFELQPTSTVPRVALKQSVANCLRTPNRCCVGSLEGKVMVLPLHIQ